MRRRYAGASRRSQNRSLSDTTKKEAFNPLVSILIRTRNRPTLLVEAIESVVSQDYRPLEIVVVNDGGDDPSPFIKGVDLTGVALRLINLPKREGRSAAANKAFEASSGRYINFLDDDDLFLPHHVSTLVKVLERQHRKVAYTACEMVEMEMDSEGVWYQKPQVLKRFSTPFEENRILFENFIPFMTLMMDREVFREVGGIDTSFEIYEDWDLIIRLSDRYTPLHIPEVTALYRVHREGGVGDARTTDDLWRWTEKIFVKHHERVSPDKLTGYLR
jgi:glycosyltransferase involved in cell wall biosynthesis